MKNNLAKFNLNKLFISSSVGLIAFITVCIYYFWLAYTVPFLADDFAFNILKNYDLEKTFNFVNSSLKWNARLGETFLKIMHYFSIPYYLVMPLLHMTNLLLGYYLIKGTKLNVFNLNHIKEFLVLFTLYIFLNSAPFEGIVWFAGTISNNFGFPFVLLFFIYIKKLLTNISMSILLHLGYLLISFLAGLSQETIPAHILASAVFVCFYLHINDINIIKYLLGKKIIILAYVLTACGWFMQAIATNFWTSRLSNFHNSWKFYEYISPIPVIIKILLLMTVILLLYYFANHKKISEKSQKIISFVFVLTILCLLTCFINVRVYWGRTFFYHSFIAGGIVFYIYINFIANNTKFFINKIIFLGICYITLNAGYLLAYNTLLEKYRSQYVFALLEKNNNKEVNLPNTLTIPSKLFFNKYAIKLSRLAKNNISILYKLSNNKNLFEWYQKNQFRYNGLYLQDYYPNTKVNFISYKEFIKQN